MMSSRVPSMPRFAMDLALLLFSFQRNSSSSRVNAKFMFVGQNVEITGVLFGLSYQNVRIAILWLPHSEPVIRDQSFAWIVSGPHLIFWFLLGLWISERIWFLLVCTICESETGIQSSRNYHSLEFPRLARLTTSSLICMNRSLSSPIVELSWEIT